MHSKIHFSKCCYVVAHLIFTTQFYCKVLLLLFLQDTERKKTAKS